MTTMHPGYCDQLSMHLAIAQDGRAAAVRQQVLEQFHRMHDPATADQVAFVMGIESDYIDVRKRVTELYQAGYLDRTGTGQSLFGKPQHAYTARRHVP